MARRCFFSFHYAQDAHRAAQVRSIGTIEGNRPATDNAWESIKSGGDAAINRWIQAQLHGKSCTVVLVGARTAGRKWITHEIVESWNAGMGVVGIRIHGLKNLQGLVSHPGENPFDYVTYHGTGAALSSIVKCYDPPGLNSKERYGWIRQYIAAALDEAVEIRKKY